MCQGQAYLGQVTWACAQHMPSLLWDVCVCAHPCVTEVELGGLNCCCAMPLFVCCATASCSGTVTVGNGTFTCGTTLSGQTCQGACNTGYSGSPVATCTNGVYTVSGTCTPGELWDGVAGTCSCCSCTQVLGTVVVCKLRLQATFALGGRFPTCAQHLSCI